MSLENGKLPDNELADIPGGRLAREAAANWLALRAEGGRKLGVWISPIGPRGSYRTYEDQVYFWNLYTSGRGNLAAHPGTSNHGWGHAIDLAAPPSMRPVIDQLGKAYGWQWGEARSENWHVTYYGGGKADVSQLGKLEHPTLKRGSQGEEVRTLQEWLAAHGWPCQADGDFGPATEKAVNELYREYGHQPRDVFGDVGWSIIEGKHPWRLLHGDERDHLADLFAQRRVAKHKGGWDHVEDAVLEHARELEAWLGDRRKQLWHNGTTEGWQPNHRRRRYLIIKHAIRSDDRTPQGALR